MKANEIIILSYINKYNRISLQEIQQALNEPVVLLANSISELYEKGYIVKGEADRFELTEKAKEESVDAWNAWLLKNKRKKTFDGNSEFKGELKNNLPVIKNIGKLKRILQLENIDYNAYHVFSTYSKGKLRTITSPSIELKERQRWILRNILEKVELENCVHGFLKGKSIKTNAQCHINKEEIMCLDIKDFFPSISSKDVNNIFLSLGYEEEIVEWLTILCIHNNKLPQGSPTSPYLANIRFKQIDRKLMKLAKDNNITYTRYADDLTFSTNEEIEPFFDRINEIVIKNGFEINEKKKHVMKGNYRKMVTGLVVKDDVKIPKYFKKKLRQEIHYCKKYGVTQHLENIGKTDAINFKEYLYGKAYYVKMVEKEYGESILRQLDQIFSIQG